LCFLLYSCHPEPCAELVSVLFQDLDIGTRSWLVTVRSVKIDKGKTMKLEQIVEYLDNLLNVKDIPDESLNGLQVANSGEVKKAAFAVDVSLASIEKAAAEQADMLIVHHGLFWGKPAPVTHGLYQRIKMLIDDDIALYGVHLPLDMHPELGNNARIEKVLGWPVKEDFGEYHGLIIGKAVEFKKPVSVDDISRRLKERLNTEPVVWNFGPEKISRVGYVSGGAISMLPEAIKANVDAFITGETRHEAYWQAREAGINVFFAGHYATETLGVKALEENIKEKLKIETVFIDLPTGY